MGTLSLLNYIRLYLLDWRNSLKEASILISFVFLNYINETLMYFSIGLYLGLVTMHLKYVYIKIKSYLLMAEYLKGSNVKIVSPEDAVKEINKSKEE